MRHTGIPGSSLTASAVPERGAGALQTLPNLTLAYHHKYQQEQQYTDRPTCFSLQFAAPWQLEKYTKKVIINSTQIETYSVWKGKIRNNSVSKELPSILRKEEVFCICFLSSKGLWYNQELVGTEEASEILFLSRDCGNRNPKYIRSFNISFIWKAWYRLYEGILKIIWVSDVQSLRHNFLLPPEHVCTILVSFVLDHLIFEGGVVFSGTEDAAWNTTWL